MRNLLYWLVFSSFYTVQSIQCLYTRQIQSATFFDLKGKQGEEENELLAKRKYEELTPTILAEQTSTSTFIGKNEVTETSFSGFTPSTDKQKVKIALKLNRLKDKFIR